MAVFHRHNQEYIQFTEGTPGSKEATEVCPDWDSKDAKEEFDKFGCMVTNFYILLNKRGQCRAVAERKRIGGNCQCLVSKTEDLKEKRQDIGGCEEGRVGRWERSL